MSKRALTSATTFYMRPRSTEPADMLAANTTVNGRDSSYSYASSWRPAVTHKRNRMSMDNKAYQPSHSDVEEESDGDTSEPR